MKNYFKKYLPLEVGFFGSSFSTTLSMSSSSLLGNSTTLKIYGRKMKKKHLKFFPRQIEEFLKAIGLPWFIVVIIIS